MNTYKVSETLLPEVRRELKRGFYVCTVYKKDDKHYCITNASSDTFHKIVKMAKAKRLSKENGLNTIPETMVNRLYMINGAKSSIISNLMQQYI